MKNALTKAHLAERIYGLEHYRPGMPDIRDIAIRITSGTTGAPSLIINKRANDGAKRKLFTDACRRIVFLVPKYASYIKWVNDFARPIAGQEPLEEIGIADIDDMRASRFATLIRDIRPDGMYSIPTSYVLESFKYLDDATRAQLAHDVRRVITGGEMIAPVERTLLSNSFPNASFYDLYGSAEADLFSVSCPHLTARYGNSAYSVFHPFDEDYVLEIEDPDDEGFGEVLLTTHELSRYRLGDIGALRDEPCACGAKRTLLIAGRKDYDRVTLYGLTFLAKILMDRMDAHRDCLRDYLLEVRAGEKDGARRGEVILHIVSQSGALSPIERERVRATVRELPVTKTRTLRSFIAEGLFAEPEVRVVEEIERRGSKRFHLQKTLL